jgi:adenine-specific DNA-methyltransferase
MTTSAHYDKFRRLLAELFMFDQADLDFGIYRIMNAKRGEIERFLERDLLPQVRETLGALQSGDRASLEAELHKAVEAAKSLGVDPESSPKVQQLRAQLGEAGDLDALEAEVFSDLYNFFRRYYRDGDFISQRRYKEGVYAIPYEGEEVKLHWANHDQYYVKSTEYFRDYTFKLRDGRRIHFKLVEADTERDNNRAPNGNERRFILCADNPLVEQDGELVARFEWRQDPDGRTQDQLTTQARDRIFATPGFARWTDELMTKAPTVPNPDRTLLERHLTEYTARNTFDYFIHKNLASFLGTELDFYIKNEIVHLDDIESESAARVEQYLAKVRAIRSIAHKIIDFLAHIEDFQKKLWLKRKFVIATHYFATLDRVPPDFFPEIIANDVQRKQWVTLFAIDELKGDLTTPGYSEPLTVDFLRENPSLILDTALFSIDFRDRLLAHLDDLDERIDGVLVNGENFQALQLLAPRYQGAVKATYIDPPYNTKKDIFPYKDGYKDGSWLSMVRDRVAASLPLLRPDGVLLSSIDWNELYNFSLLLNSLFGVDNRVGDIVWRNARDNNPTRIATEHEFILCYANNLNSTEQVWKNEFADAKEILLAEYERLKSEGLAASDIQIALREFIRDNREILAEVDRYKFVDDGGVYTGSQSVHNPHPGGYEYDVLHPDTGRPMRLPANGYRFPPETMKRDYIDKNRLIYGPDENRIVQIKLYLSEYKDSLRSVIDLDGRLGAYALNALFGPSCNLFDNPKPPQLLRRLLSFASVPDSLVLDFFAGSGTTIQAVLEVARMTKVRMRYIAVEMANYFDTVLCPRVKKAVYSSLWQAGKPAKRDGSTHVIKCIRLESYEDALNNLVVRRRDDQRDLLDSEPALREDYTLRYMLDEETRGSPSLLNVRSFEDPFNYRMRIATGTVGETKDVAVDLVETFNWLLGLRVKHIDTIRGVRVVDGANSDGERVLVLWRNTKEIDNDKLDEWFTRQGYNTRDQEYAIIYVNGDNNLENLRRADQTWKVRITEDEFHRLMFDVQDV